MMKNEITIDVREVLEALGINNVRETGNEVNYSCPSGVHKHGDHRPSAYCRGSYPYPYICFGCGAQGTIVDIVSEYLGIERAKAWRWLGERFGFDTAYDPTESIAETLNRILGPKSKPENKVLGNPVIDPQGFFPLEAVRAGWDYMVDRGIKEYTLRQFDFQWDPKSGRVAIPIRDHLNNLIGFKARDITGEKEPKYLVLGDRKRNEYGFAPYNSSLVLFGLFLHRNSPGQPLVVTEGELNSLRIYEAGFHAVGLPTAALSEFQSCIIREGFENVILFLDSDEAGKKGTTKALNMLQGACNVRVVPDHQDDPMEMTNEQIKTLISQATNPLTQTLKNLGE